MSDKYRLKKKYTHSAEMVFRVWIKATYGEAKIVGTYNEYTRDEFENNIINELQELVSDEKYKCGKLEELKYKHLSLPECKEGHCHSLLTLDVVAVGRTGILYDVIIKKIDKNIRA
ncbi:hypothetical protein K9O30_12985 [Clostridium bowmanii]|uniref:hypothetical protein n=1 Tax=Clostridium bowmanii TaxID=132925 RepID=UPI001C0C5786|nr:hypothetical protein [Clostridium bowmanii]MBU3189945.1 hypothetical protein [Clostridium bowmanii]MCA1074621.1 hypothetical protein [Clostridium bowmanii]